jgi:hypothetical protein
MTQDYSVEVFAPEEPDPPATAGGAQRARAHEVANGRSRPVTEVGGRFEGGEVRRSHGFVRATRASADRVAAPARGRSDLAVFADDEGARGNWAHRRCRVSDRRQCPTG